jgi:tetratricopeptide (TPR) repeat protein
VFPEAGETLAGLRLLREIGRGAKGRVFLATQPELADRPLVLKVTPCDGQEHLSLARLQHTNIVPLYWARDFADRNLRALCMPYLGGVTLGQILAALRARPPADRTGADLLRELDRLQGAAPVALPTRGPARDFFARVSYVDAVCAVGRCLAEALQYAHERGLVHLDVKASNVLLAADGQPMLLDFHLARAPLRRGQPVPEWFGGTPEYMSPEQLRALEAVRQRRPVPADIDARSDVYALGLLLYEALGGAPPAQGPAVALSRLNPDVGAGLSDLVGRCLAADPSARYPSAGAVAADLRRHQENRPLQGVANRPVECWRKWRRRRPHALLVGLLLALVGAVVLGSAGLGLAFRDQRLRAGRSALEDGRAQLAQGHPDEAVTTFRHGLDAVRNIPGGQDLARELATEGRRAERAGRAQALHVFADQVRFRFDGDSPMPALLRQAEAHCREIWASRDDFLQRQGAELPEAVEEQIRTDLLDLALFRAGLRARPAEGVAGRQEALALLAEAEAVFGPSPALAFVRRRCAAGDSAAAAEAQGPDSGSAWDHYTLGRSLLQAGDLGRASAELARAVDLQPDGFWPRFHQGVCLDRLGKHRDAMEAFRVCIALSPGTAECFYNLARAEAAHGDPAAALADYDKALRLAPGLAEAHLNRSALWRKQKHFDEALADLWRALDHGADAAVVFYNRALVHEEQGDRDATLADLARALEADPGHREARRLRDQLRRAAARRGSP